MAARGHVRAHVGWVLCTHAVWVTYVMSLNRGQLGAVVTASVTTPALES